MKIHQTTARDAQTMAELAQGQGGVVTGLRTAGSMRRRLQDIGLTEGTPVRCLWSSPAGDPRAYLIRGAIIALRDQDSAGVLIEPRGGAEG